MIQEFGEEVVDDYWEEFLREQEQNKQRLLPDAEAKKGPRKDSKQSSEDHSTDRSDKDYSWEASLRPLEEGFKPGSLDDLDSWSWASMQNNRMAKASDTSSPPLARPWSPLSEQSGGHIRMPDLPWSSRQNTLASVCRVSSENTAPVDIETGLGEVYEGAGTADRYPSCHRPFNCADWKRSSDREDPALTTPKSKSRNAFVLDNRSSALASSVRDPGLYTMGIEDIRLEKNKSDIRVQSPTSDGQQLRAKEEPATPEDEEPEQWVTPPQTPNSTEAGGCGPPAASLVRSTKGKPSAPENVSTATEGVQANEHASPEAQPSKIQLERQMFQPLNYLAKPIVQVSSLISSLRWFTSAQNLTEETLPKLSVPTSKGQPSRGESSKEEMLAEQGLERRSLNEVLSKVKASGAEASDRGQLMDGGHGSDQPAAAEETLPTARRLVFKQSIANVDTDGTGGFLKAIVADHFNAWLDLLTLFHAICERFYVWSTISYQRLRLVGDAENTPELPTCPPIVLGSRVSGYILFMHAMLTIHLYVLSGLQRERLIWMMANQRTREYLLERMARYGGGGQLVWADWDLLWSPQELWEMMVGATVML